MWGIIFEAIKVNLIDVGIGMGLFFIAYLANMSFSIFLNIKILNQNFEMARILDSFLKVITFAVGSALLTIAITTIPIFCNAVGFTIPEEYIEVFSKLAILAITLTAACKYAVEAFGKMRAILASSVDNTKDVEAIIEEKNIADTIEKKTVASTALAAVVEKVVAPIITAVTEVDSALDACETETVLKENKEVVQNESEIKETLDSLN